MRNLAHLGVSFELLILICIPIPVRTLEDLGARGCEAFLGAWLQGGHRFSGGNAGRLHTRWKPSLAQQRAYLAGE
eukprot:237084-Karenia_brevis.AAC.1